MCKNNEENLEKNGIDFVLSDNLNSLGLQANVKLKKKKYRIVGTECHHMCKKGKNEINFHFCLNVHLKKSSQKLVIVVPYGGGQELRGWVKGWGEMFHCLSFYTFTFSIM